MKKISPLPDRLIAQIAAGEVIEQPLYAIKELIDNAIDAKAKSIKIELTDFGLKSIIVSDDGEGMDKEDLLECFKLHSTSKLSSQDSLVGIKTLGFRGEALSAIAAISDLTIQTKTKNQLAGNQIFIRASQFEKIIPVGISIGTTVRVDNLFYPVPARKKFVEQKITQLKKIIELISRFSLAYHQIHFTLIHNKRTLLDFLPNHTFENRIYKVLGPAITSQLLPFSKETPYLKISGLLAKPQASSSNKNKQYIFVNKRIVQDKLLSQVFKQAYATLLPSSQSPIFVLFLDTPFEMIDVNIHPRKEQIKFLNIDTVYQEVKDIIKKTLLNTKLVYSGLKISEQNSEKLTQTFAGTILKEETATFNPKDVFELLNPEEVFQIHQTYLITQTKNGAVLIDQHGAHERILYEQFLNEFRLKKEKLEKFVLPKAITVELPLVELTLLKSNQKLLKNLGFEWEEFGEAIKVISIPLLYKGRQLAPLITDLIQELTEEETFKEVDSKSDKLLKYLACRSAIMAGEKLTKQEAKDLIKKLEETPRNSTCPHGRPTKIEILLKQMHKEFKRL